MFSIFLLAILPVCSWAEVQLGEAIFSFDGVTNQSKWKSVEGDLGQPFIPAFRFPANARTQHFIGTAGDNPAALDEARTGTLESPPFLVTDQFYRVLIGGGAHYDETFISVLDATTKKETWRTAGTGTPQMSAYPLDLSAVMGQQAILQVVDKRTSDGGYVLFGGLYKTDQAEARTELVRFFINLLNFSHSRSDASNWLSKNLKSEHLPILYDALHKWRNGPLLQFCIEQVKRFPTKDSIAPLLHVARTADEQRARYACYAIGDMANLIDPGEQQEVESVLTQLLDTHEGLDLRIIAAGTLVKIGTPSALAAINRAAAGGQPPKVAESLRFLINSKQFTATSFTLPSPGGRAECWLRGMQYYVYLPLQWTPEKEWPLIVMQHGTWGNGHFYGDVLQSECNRLGAVGIGPTFDPHRFWGFGHFGGKWRPDLALIEIIQSNKAALRLKNEPCVMIGHSEGAQFVGRFVLVHPGGVKRAAISGTDELAMPDPNVPFPFGTGDNAEMGISNLSPEAWIKVPFMLIVGTNDVKANIAISHKWATAVNKYALENKLPGSVHFVKHVGGIHTLKSNYPYMQEWVSKAFY